MSVAMPIRGNVARSDEKRNPIFARFEMPREAAMQIEMEIATVVCNFCHHNVVTPRYIVDGVEAIVAEGVVV